MSVEKREQVFVSSTFKDLTDERAAVIQTLLEADCIPAGMEMFPASDSDKFDLIKNVIDLCDYYIVIIGGRYGSVDQDVQLSYTEMEYDYAVSTKKPVMAFLHGSPGRIPGEKLDLDADLRQKLDAFRAKAEQRMVKYWNDPGDLKGQVALAMIQIRKSHPAVGWIRATEAMTPEVKTELAELRARVRELTAQETIAAASAHLDRQDLVDGADTVELECELEFHWKEELDDGTARPSNRHRGVWKVNPSWNSVFTHVGPELMDEASEVQLITRLSELCLTLSQDDLIKNDELDQDVPPPTSDDRDPTDQAGSEGDGPVGAIYNATVSTDSFDDVKVHLVALGLIQKGAKRRSTSDSNTYWCLTENGNRQLLSLRALRKPATTIVPID